MGIVIVVLIVGAFAAVLYYRSCNNVVRVNNKVTSMILSHTHPRLVIEYLNSEGFIGATAHRFINDVVYGPHAYLNFTNENDRLEAATWSMVYGAFRGQYQKGE
ncbi:MAG: hypothetical protein LLF76_02695 [Planctomycetaceae bacterium]|nr:hypothetical protein [Planctomycetaceae bacterium]